MSRIGKQPVVIPKGVKIQVQKEQILVEGAKGKNTVPFPRCVQIAEKDGKLIVTRIDDEKQSRATHGTIRALLAGAVKGSAEGYKKELDIVGVGYKASMKGPMLHLALGFSHPVEVPVPAGLKVATPNPNRIIVEGAGKQQVGEFAAKVKKICPVEPYQGKGIRYVGEVVRKKLGKALAK